MMLRCFCAASCEPMLVITTSERTGPWTNMRRSPARPGGSESLIHARSLADFITTTSGFRISVHTRSKNSGQRVRCPEDRDSVGRGTRGLHDGTPPLYARLKIGLGLLGRAAPGFDAY